MVVLLDSAMLTAVRVSQGGGGSLFPCSPLKLPYVRIFPHVFLICSLLINLLAMFSSSNL